ncbi:MAG: tRNA (adenosine(37)-N6)-threonylcarbamoyltransferase complex ATPase subunit type 1 TsaE [Chloroflexi bacterium]|nr:tRNA (adenosine(37)-N6)-threonylcarbamoyltransferase complex ATPase subunit type 1 TsaE [Chloroflexota bacterium]
MALAGWLHDGDILLLHGDLGAGKTTLAKGIAEALGIDAVVASPSFSLVNEYDTGPGAPVTRLYHLDLYRLQGADDLASIGFDDFAGPAKGATIVEWPERAATVLPDRYVLIEIESTGAESRSLRFVPVPDDGWWNHRFVSLRTRIEAAITHGSPPFL